MESKKKSAKDSKMSESAIDQTGITRRDLLIGTAVAVATIPFQGAYAAPISNPPQT
jgi:hypothetical protein